MQNEKINSAMQYVQKKGVSYFLNTPSPEDVSGFKGVLFTTDGYPILSSIYKLAEMPI